MTAAEVVACCRALAGCSEESGATTRTFLSPPMREVHARLTHLMEAAGMQVHVDAAGNLRAVYPGMRDTAPRLIVGSHLDTVRHAGAFDGVLGVVLGVALVQRLGRRRLPFGIDVIGFSEEEGVRFGVPFIGSRAVTGTLTSELLERQDADGCTVRDAIRHYGLNPDELPQATIATDVIGYLELHIEQGPVLDLHHVPLGVVSAIAGQSRFVVTFTGVANHAGTTPMTARRDALAGAAEWIMHVEQASHRRPGLVATVGRLEVPDGAANVIPGECTATLDVRHAQDAIRVEAAARLVAAAREIAQRRGLAVNIERRHDQPAVPTDSMLRTRLEHAVAACGYPVHVMASGAGHDAMVMAARMPVAMLFLRTPAGISHHPDESVREEDVEAALRVGGAFLDGLAQAHRD
jgi:allantoate deiminase